MMRAKKKMLELIGLKCEQERQLYINRKRYESLKHEIEKYSGIFNFFEGEYGREIRAEMYYKAQEDIIEGMLLPESVCQNEASGLSLNLDITC